MQTIFKIPEDKKDLLPELIKVDAENIPDLGIKGGSVKLLVGRLGEVESPAKVQALPRVVMLMVTADSEAKMEVPLDSDLEHGYVYVFNGKCKLAGGQDWLALAGRQACAGLTPAQWFSPKAAHRVCAGLAPCSALRAAG